jgi:hypothetical protein
VGVVVPLQERLESERFPRLGVRIRVGDGFHTNHPSGLYPQGLV